MLHWISRAIVAATLTWTASASAGTYQVQYRLDINDQYFHVLGPNGTGLTEFNPNFTPFSEFGSLKFAYDPGTTVFTQTTQFPDALETIVTKPLGLLAQTPSSLEPILLSLNTLGGQLGALTAAPSFGQYQNVFADRDGQPDISFQFLRFVSELSVTFPLDEDPPSAPSACTRISFSPPSTRSPEPAIST